MRDVGVSAHPSHLEDVERVRRRRTGVAEHCGQAEKQAGGDEHDHHGGGGDRAAARHVNQVSHAARQHPIHEFVVAVLQFELGFVGQDRPDGDPGELEGDSFQRQIHQPVGDQSAGESADGPDQQGFPKHQGQDSRRREAQHVLAVELLRHASEGRR